MPHIKEKAGTEGMDWDSFYGMDAQDNQKWGPKAWQLAHDWADNIPCSTCKETAQIMISGIHDMVNVHKGKGILNQDRWENFLGMVDDARKHNPHLKHFREIIKESSVNFDPHSFRIIKQGPKTEIRIGCPAGHFHSGSCKIGTRAQAILHRID